VATTDRFAALINGVLGREGGYSNNAADRGGETMWGVTVARARAAGYTAPMKAMSRQQAIDIYCLYYWTQPAFDRIDEIDAPLGERLFDAGINCGTGRAGQWLQRALNVMNARGTYYPDLAVDGLCGAMTRAALNSFIQRRGPAGRVVLLEAVKSFQAAHYLGLAEGDATQEDFIFGWMRSRILGLA
jgi:lysozyme family protein